MKFTPPRTVAHTRQELFEVIEKVREYRGISNFFGYPVHEMYRGQANADWKLSANLVRNLKDAEEAKAIERQMIVEFDSMLRKEGLDLHVRREFLTGEYHSEWLLLQQAQHFGLPTRFMDWSIDWEVSLYFAVANPALDNVDAQFWIYIVPDELFVSDGNKEKNKYLQEDPFSSERSFFLNSSDFMDDESSKKIAQRRKFRQNGRFYIQPYDNLMIPLEEQQLHKENLFLITIPASAKANIRKELEAKGITLESLYVEQHPRINEIIADLRTKYSV